MPVVWGSPGREQKCQPSGNHGRLPQHLRRISSKSGCHVPSNFWPMFTSPTPLFWVQEFLDFEPHTRQRVSVDVIPAEVWHSRRIQTSLRDQRKPSKRSLRPTKSSQMRWMVKWKINVYTRFLSALTIWQILSDLILQVFSPDSSLWFIDVLHQMWHFTNPNIIQ